MLVCPRAPYTPDIFTTKVQLVFDHVLTAYGDDGESAYDPRPDVQFASPAVAVEYDAHIDVNKIADDVVARILADPSFAAQVAQQLQGSTATHSRIGVIWCQMMFATGGVTRRHIQPGNKISSDSRPDSGT